MPGQPCRRPLSGKVFYLDLPSNKKTAALEDDVKQLGGTVEKFFSKEIKYLVSNKREAKYVEHLRQDSPVPSPEPGHSSPAPQPSQHRPGNHGDAPKSGSRGQTEPVVTSRGKSLVDRVVKEQERIQINKTLSNALEWGVKVLYIDDVMAYVEKRKKWNVINQCVSIAPVKKRAKVESKGRPGYPKSKVTRIRAPFLKVEDASRHYRPIYVAMPKMPEINLKTTLPCPPFCLYNKELSGRKCWHSDEKGRSKKRRDKKQVGFCECCMLHYENLVKHVQSECHVAFSKSDAYLVLDALISTMQCNFVPFKRNSSILSTLVASGPYRRVHQNPGTREKRNTGCGEPSAEQALKCAAIPTAVQTTDHKGKLRNCDKPSVRCHPSGSSLSCTHPASTPTVRTPIHPAELGQTLTPEAEMAPSISNSSAFIPAALPRATQAIPKNLNACIKSPASHCQTEDVQSGHQSGGPPVPLSLHDVYDDVPDSQFECGEVSPVVRTCVPECRRGGLSTKTGSPVRTIQRKVKIYTRKRHKVDVGSTRLEPVEPGGGDPDKAALSLCCTSYCDQADLQSGFPSNGQHAACDDARDSQVQCNGDTQVLPQEKACVPEPDMDNFPTTEPFQVRRIQRKVRVYRRKGRKVDVGSTRLEPVQPGGGVPNTTTLSLCRTSYGDRAHLRNGFPLNVPNVLSSQRALCDNAPDAQEKACKPESDTDNLTVTKQSPVRTIQRKVRVYKRKRWKADVGATPLEPVQPRGGVPKSSLLSLYLQLFQSSDDPDVEFRDFED